MRHWIKIGWKKGVRATVDRSRRLRGVIDSQALGVLRGQPAGRFSVTPARNLQNMIARGKEVLVYQKAPQAAAAE